MRNRRYKMIALATLICGLCQQCGKGSDGPDVPPAPAFSITATRINGQAASRSTYNVNRQPVIKISFSTRLNQSLVGIGMDFRDAAGNAPALTLSYENNDSTLVITPNNLNYLTKYTLRLTTDLRSLAGGALIAADSLHIITKIDSTRKFATITDNALLDLVQQQTFKYFWDFAHPASGLARERSNGDNNIVTSGGSGFGIMAIITAINRGFITRAQGLARMQTIVNFLKNTAQTFHGAFPHWLNGSSGVVIPFSIQDNGADLVETSYLVQGLLCARQYFNDAGAPESTLRTDINTICNRVEWSWFRQNNQNVLYWHWSPDLNWAMNMPIRGWNECLITYVLAASSATFGVPPVVYTNGWAGGAGFTNGASYHGIQLPLGPAYGGPLFFSHYSFLGIDPTGLTDAYANYATQTKNHTLINYNACKINTRNYFGYSDSVWGLTASDIPNGYAASSPANDLGVIAPTAALSSFPYTPAESMAALKFYYYVLGDKLWKQYGFVDAFSLHDVWFANSHLAIDQGPVIVMIENYRSGLLWDLFMSCPEVETGMTALGFTSPHF